MIIKLTLIGLIIALIAVVASSYYVNKEGFDNITAQTLNTCTGDCNNTLTAANKVCRAVAQTDGNYVIYDSTNKPMWASNTYGKGAAPYRTVMQSDGNLVLYDKNNQPTWASNTSGKGVAPYRLVMQDDCNLVIYDKNNQPTWASKSNPVTPGLSYNPAPAPAGETPANISLAKLQQLFNNAGCTRTLVEGDQTKWWRSRPTVNDIIADMKEYGRLTNSCTGSDSQHNFCNPDKCKKPVVTATPVMSGAVTTGQVNTPTPLLAAVIPQQLASAAAPQRTEVVPEVSLSTAGYDAMVLQQKMDLLKDIQKVVRNELIANRTTDPVGMVGSAGKVTDSTAQGKEYEESCYKGTEYRCPKNPDGTCPPIPDMSNYIKKDQIPCWGCAIDY